MTVSMSLNHQRLRPPPILNKPMRCPMAWGIVAAAVPLAICTTREDSGCEGAGCEVSCTAFLGYFFGTCAGFQTTVSRDRKSTRLNSSHTLKAYAVCGLK